MSDNVVDLNALMPPSRTIRFGNPPRDIEIKPPRTSDILQLAALGQKMQNAADLTPEETDKLFDDMLKVIYKAIPELNGEELITPQVIKLFEILGEMSMPSDAKALESRGVSSDPIKKAE